MSDDRYLIPAVERATRLLECLCESPAPLGVTEISREIGVNKNMVFRLLHTLERRGWVVQEDGPKYRVGLRPFRSFAKPARAMGVRQAAAEPLKTLWRETGEACYMAVLDDDRCLFLEHHDSTRPVRAHGCIGGRYELHSCAPGKALLAHAHPTLQERVLGGELEPNTSATITCPGKLREELDAIRERGYATDLEEYTRGMFCVAAPIFDGEGRPAGALGLTVLTLYYTQGELITLLAPKVLTAAREASANLGAELEAA